MIDIMLDLETMGTDPNAAIIAIGAVAFDPLLGVLGNEFYRTIDLKSAVNAGGVIDPDTVLWWLQQSDEARKEFTERQTDFYYDAAYDFENFCTHVASRTEILVWGNGAAFDNVILRNSLQKNDIVPPWEFRNDRCYRTVRNMYRVPAPERVGVAHNALDDAKNQALHLMKILEVVNERR